MFFKKAIKAQKLELSGQDAKILGALNNIVIAVGNLVTAYQGLLTTPSSNSSSVAFESTINHLPP